MNQDEKEVNELAQKLVDFLLNAPDEEVNTKMEAFIERYQLSDAPEHKKQMIKDLWPPIVKLIRSFKP